jgi:hypothetical protein
MERTGPAAAGGLVFCAFLVLPTGASVAGTDPRFGTVGPGNGHWPWVRYYNEDFSALPDPPDPNRLYTVGKLDNPRRSTAGEDWCREGIGWLDCERSLEGAERHKERYDRIFRHEQEGIRTLIGKFNLAYNGRKGPEGYASGPSIHITVGNEPNWHPYVHPEAYAWVFERYHDFIKGPGGLGCAACVVHTGGVLLLNPAAGLAAARTRPQSLAQPALQPLQGAILAGTLLLRLRPDYKAWTRRFLEALAVGGGRYDVFDIHAYDVDLDWNGIVLEQSALDGLEGFMDLVRSAGCPGRRGLGPCGEGAEDPVFWIDEFGLIRDRGGSSGTALGGSAPRQEPAAAVMEKYVRRFKALPAIRKWFWYKHHGMDAHFQDGWFSRLDLNGFDPERIGLCQDAACSRLDSLGRKYLSLQDPLLAEPRRRDGAAPR